MSHSKHTTTVAVNDSLDDSRASPGRSSGYEFNQSADSSGFVSASEGESDSSALLESRVRKLRALRDLEYEPEAHRTDRSSPLYSNWTFEQLKIGNNLLKGLYKMGLHQPSRIQENALQILMADPPVNMIAQSQSGTGKTVTFLLASLSRIDKNLPQPQVLILSPTFELAEQTAAVAERVLLFSPEIRVRYAVRGQVLTPGSQIREQIVIGTPGKMLDWALKYRFFDISKIKVFVLDEADVMIAEAGHRDQSIRLHNRLAAGCQMMLFSATYDAEITEFAKFIVPDPCAKISLRRDEEFPENVMQYTMYCPGQETKQRALENIYCSLSVGQALIFCRTKISAGRITDTMRKLGQNVLVLTGDHSTADRAHIIEQFRIGLAKVLVSTNLCARGIDIEQVSLVVNFDLPLTKDGDPDFDTYLHRVGRTGRFGRPGVAIDLIDPYDEAETVNIKKIRDRYKRHVTVFSYKDFLALHEQ